MEIWSHSRLGAFEKCPLQYKYAYLDKLPREVEFIEAFMGSRFHEAMEFIYREAPQRLPLLDEVIDVYEHAWAEHYSDRVRIVRRGKRADDFRSIGRTAIRAFYARYQPFTQEETLGIEEKIAVALAGGDYALQGYIDRVARRPDGIIVIHDYKTANNVPQQEQADRDRQLGLYQLAMQEKYPEAPGFALVWHYVVHDRELCSTRSAAQLAQLRTDMAALIDTIRAATEFPAKTSALCGWCAYQDACPARRG